jgi:hypothetical protein
MLPALHHNLTTTSSIDFEQKSIIQKQASWSFEAIKAL